MSRVYLTMCIFVVCAAAAAAQTDSTCLERAAARLKSDERIRVLTADSTRIEGRYFSVDVANSLLTLYSARIFRDAAPLAPRSDSAGPNSLIIDAGDIAAIEYQRPGAVRPQYVILMAFLGAAIGQGIEYAIDPGYDYALFPFRRPRAYTHGNYIGLAAGGVVGIILTAVLPGTRTIACAADE